MALLFTSGLLFTLASVSPSPHLPLSPSLFSLLSPSPSVSRCRSRCLSPPPARPPARTHARTHACTPARTPARPHARTPTTTEGLVIAINYNYGCNLIGQTCCRVAYPQISVLSVVCALASFVVHSVVFGSSSFLDKHSACLEYSATRTNKLCINKADHTKYITMAHQSIR